MAGLPATKPEGAPPAPPTITLGQRPKGVTVKQLLQQFWTDESGQGLTEYASIVALVSVALILVLIAFRNELGRIFNAMRNELNTEVGSINQAST